MSPGIGIGIGTGIGDRYSNTYRYRYKYRYTRRHSHRYIYVDCYFCEVRNNNAEVFVTRLETFNPGMSSHVTITFGLGLLVWCQATPNTIKKHDRRI